MTLRPAVFLDRDGTLVREAEYLADPNAVELLPGVPDALRRLRAAGLALVVVTNQSGIARGLYAESDYRRVAARLDELLEAAGCAVDATYYCPHHPEVGGPCECRKPALGMYRRAARELGVALARSYFVGDKPTDVTPSEAVGGVGILVRSGYGRDHEAAGAVPRGAVVVDALPEAADWILAHRPRDARTPVR